jgi:hypothetical protein
VSRAPAPLRARIQEKPVSLGQSQSVTLFLNRLPHVFFTQPSSEENPKKKAWSGLWGELIAIKGPTVNSATVVPTGAAGPDMIPLNQGFLKLEVDGPIVEQKRYETMERYWVDVDHSTEGTFILLHPDKYFVTYTSPNAKMAKLSGPPGRCFVIEAPNGAARAVKKPGHPTKAEKAALERDEKEHSIWIHEAPWLGWLDGCISPRIPGGGKQRYKDGRVNPSSRAMDQLFHFVGSARTSFYVLNW